MTNIVWENAGQHFKDDVKSLHYYDFNSFRWKAQDEAPCWTKLEFQ